MRYAIIDNTSSPALRALAEELGVSERQLHRRCVTALGYGPKTLERILRFQRFQTLALKGAHVGLAELALLAGYVDQSHLTRECGRLTGQTPRRFLASRQPIALH